MVFVLTKCLTLCEFGRKEDSGGLRWHLMALR